VIRPRAATAAALAVAAALAAVARAAVPALHFTDQTARSGIDVVLTSGRSPATQILEVKGGGLALIDYDNDGDLDLFLPNGAYLDATAKGPGARLYENDGHMRFTDVTARSGIDFHGWGMGVAVGDVDGNGFDDLYVAAYGPDVLLLNDGNKRFTDATARAGLGDARWSTAAAFSDLDGDGDLDLYVANYVEFDPSQTAPRAHVLRFARLRRPFRDDGGARRPLRERGRRPLPRHQRGLRNRRGPAVLWPRRGDPGLRRRRRQDVFVGNDSMPSFLWINKGRLRFAEQGLTAAWP
jgi:hypothetical protein